MKPLTTPGFKLDEKELASRETEIPLESADATSVQELCHEIDVPFPG